MFGLLLLALTSAGIESTVDVPVGCGPSPLFSAAMVPDDNGNYYILDGTQGQILFFDVASNTRSAVVSIYDDEEEFRTTFGMVRGDDGTLWVGRSQTNFPLRRVDPERGTFDLIDNAFPSGSVTPELLARDPMGRIYMAGPLGGVITRYDPTTGEADVINIQTDDGLPPFSGPAGMQVLESGDILIVDLGAKALFRIDGVSGERSIITSSSVGSGPPLSIGGSIFVRENGNYLLESDFLGAIIEVDSVTGDRSILVEPDLYDSYESIMVVSQIISEANSQLILAGNFAGGNTGVALFSVDLDTGVSTVMTVGSAITEAVVRSDGDVIFARPFGSTIYQTNLQTGDTVARFKSSLTSDARIRGLSDMVLDGDETLFFVNPNRGIFGRIDLALGQHTVLSGEGIGSGPNLFAPGALAMQSDGNFLVAGVNALYHVDRNTGDRTIVSGGPDDRGSGPLLINVPDAVLMSDTTALVVEGRFSQLLSVDIATGDRVLVSGEGRGDGPPLISTATLVLVNSNLAYVKGQSLIQVDLVTGDRVAVSDPDAGPQDGARHSDIDLLSDGTLIGAGGYDVIGLFDPVTQSHRFIGDEDGDGQADQCDNCTAAFNPSQFDADGDGFGNQCDADLNNDCVVNVVDLGLLRAVFFGTDGAGDLNGDGTVNAVDLGLMRMGFFGQPGPAASGNCVVR